MPLLITSRGRVSEEKPEVQVSGMIIYCIRHTWHPQTPICSRKSLSVNWELRLVASRVIKIKISLILITLGKGCNKLTHK